MNIPEPKVHINEPVLVFNYKRKAKPGVNLWEEGTVHSLAYKFYAYDPTPYWRYSILLDRKSETGGVLFLKVGADRVKKINE